MIFPLHSLRRYPVKAMGGETVAEVELTPRGILGDRWYAVTDTEGHFASGKNTRRFRRHDEVFEYAARTVADSADDAGAVGPRVQVSHGTNTWEVGDAELAAHLSKSFGTSVTVLPEVETPHFDDGAVSLVGTASLEWCEKEFGINADPRRIRVNIVIGTDEPFIEESWVGRVLSIGDTRLRVTGQISRCRMIDLDQDGVEVRGKWLKPLGQTRGGKMGIYAEVLQPGRITAADSVEVADPQHAVS